MNFLTARLPATIFKVNFDMKKTLLLILLIPVLTFGQDKAERLAHRYIITDGHVDLPY